MSQRKQRNVSAIRHRERHTAVRQIRKRYFGPRPSLVPEGTISSVLIT
jgi:hypothetical protein